MANISFDQIPGKLMACMMQSENYINGLTCTNHAQLELIRYYASVLNQCAYCIDMHFKEAVAAGESTQRLYAVAVWRDVSFYSEQEQALLAWTEAVTDIRENSGTRQASFEHLLHFYTREEIANLTLAIAQMNTWNRLAKSFGFEAGTYKVGAYA
ncbi:carboxymuconolactone decarboxylase family protein [Photobacterium sp. TY1-4]|uniref:carboxymuconolactone decarboxylase family protein n=1 Tax=Photobacterium sp. TY1-4 TaxID=2899122 RepID=UPI0021C21AD0|nr:carboxymuconolactone decarboxylase family protein [Photobacterium sp. TY1-4]UXI03164.1 carboxymuconolactone decarboxylase family protein [Photobacterium sp. TY1-4]